MGSVVRTLLPAPVAHAELLSGVRNIPTRNSRKMGAHCNVGFTPDISSPSKKDEAILRQSMGDEQGEADESDFIKQKRFPLNSWRLFLATAGWFA